MAGNITASLSKGAAVVATGRLRCRTWEADDGSKRAAVEMTVDDLGPSLRRAIAKVTKATREHANGTTALAPAGNGHQAAAVTAAAGEPASALPDEPPF
jgi:single-strand DNA-binding protein